MVLSGLLWCLKLVEAAGIEFNSCGVDFIDEILSEF